MRNESGETHTPKSADRGQDQSVAKSPELPLKRADDGHVQGMYHVGFAGEANDKRRRVGGHIAPRSLGAPCQGCEHAGQTNKLFSDKCKQFQLHTGCHACDTKGCWTENIGCSFKGRMRENDTDAGFGDKVSHMAGERNIQILSDGARMRSGHGARIEGKVNEEAVLRSVPVKRTNQCSHVIS